ncbi:hypothetical protein BO86DRAFT_446822 [Aspergillus japonicus CBS 114.51]|uniref:HNH nuclease domain-containing protein n=1 Tax=Aspergillus japonicus CBS 114.51 TaxID=1448312 RepID=A0A8T8X8G4_ASPJA|nr:hypothetical protein BO86DRAFT_446822 [Aspergillus japonicus CBS 114.51]RAH83729.1 hypothetical protein BO86DRAFT_446822 [Aspergillus japonicus CBS 114.51]
MYMAGSVGPGDELVDKERPSWACIRLSDIEVLKELVKRLRESNMHRLLYKSCLRQQDCSEMLTIGCARPKWKSRDEIESACKNDQISDENSDADFHEVISSGKRVAGPIRRQSPSKIPRIPTTPSPQKAATSMISACELRDESTCVITGFREPIETAHIYPVSLGHQSKADQAQFWETLSLFWTSERVESWKAEILGPQGTEHCAHLMCLSNIAHKLWEKGRFALYPLFWLPTMAYRTEQSLRRSPSPVCPNLTSHSKDGVPYATSYKLATDEKIQSGETLTMRTTDPVNLPLPSIKLLQLQWLLHRVLAMSGVADASEEDLDSDFGIPPGAGICWRAEHRERERAKERDSETPSDDEGEGVIYTGA